MKTQKVVFARMNFMNVNWNGSAFAGNPIPSNKQFRESLETNPYNPSFSADSQGYNNHFETAHPSVSISKSSPEVTIDPVRQ